MLIEISWNGEETVMRYTQEFLTAHRVLQLDALVDAQCLLEDLYESLLKEKNTQSRSLWRGQTSAALNW